MKIFLIWFGFIGRTISAAATALESQTGDYDECKRRAKEHKDKIKTEQEVKDDSMANMED